MENLKDTLKLIGVGLLAVLYLALVLTGLALPVLLVVYLWTHL